jgi:hypothetical protein
LSRIFGPSCVVLARRFAVENVYVENFGLERREYLYGALSWLTFLMRCAADVKGKTSDLDRHRCCDKRYACHHSWSIMLPHELLVQARKYTEA